MLSSMTLLGSLCLQLPTFVIANLFDCTLPKSKYKFDIDCLHNIHKLEKVKKKHGCGFIFAKLCYAPILHIFHYLKLFKHEYLFVVEIPSPLYAYKIFLFT